MSDYSYPYPHAPGRPVAGVLAGSPPPSDPGHIQGPRIASGPFVIPAIASQFDPNSQKGAQIVPYPTGSPTPLNYVQVYNFTVNPVVVTQQGTILDIVPGGTVQTLSLLSIGASLAIVPLQLVGVSNSVVYLVWSTDKLSEDVAFGGSTQIINGVDVLPAGATSQATPVIVSNNTSINGTVTILGAVGNAILTSAMLTHIGPGSSLLLAPGSVPLLATGSPGTFTQSYPFGAAVTGAGVLVTVLVSGAGAGTLVYGTVTWTQ